MICFESIFQEFDILFFVSLDEGDESTLSSLTDPTEGRVHIVGHVY